MIQFFLFLLAMKITKEKVFKFILIILGLLILWYSGSVVVYIITSLILALLLSPLNQAIRRIAIRKWHVSDALSAGISMMILMGVLLLILNIFVPVVTREVKLLSEVNMDEFYEVIEPEVKSISKFFVNQDHNYQEGQTEKELIKKMLVGKKNLDRVPDFFSGVATGLGGSVIAVFSVFFITFFLLKDDNLFNDFVFSLSDSASVKRVESVLTKVKTTLSRYFVGIVIQVTLITFLVSTGLSLFGFKNAVVIGLFAGIMNVIPYLGPLIGLAFGLLIGISTNAELANIDSFWTVFGEITLVFGLTQLFDNFVTQPVVFSKSINAHPLEIFLVILLAGNISGITGMIIAVPLYSVIRIIAKEYYGDSRFVRFMTQTMKY